MSGFATCSNKGFQITVNGFVLSVQFGTSNYCERRNYDPKAFGSEQNMDTVFSRDAEIAIWEENDMSNFLQIDEHEQVRGWVSALAVAKIIGFLATVKRGDVEAVTDFVRAVSNDDEELVGEVVKTPAMVGNRSVKALPSNSGG